MAFSYLDSFQGKVIAHRGLVSTEFIENSSSAIKYCVENNIPIEIDLQYHESGCFFVFHDEDLNRIFGWNNLLNKVPKESIRLLKYKDGTEILELKDLLSIVSGKVPLLIEVKVPKGLKVKNISNIALSLSRFLDGYNGDLAIQSFNPIFLNCFKRLNLNYPVGQIICNWDNISSLNKLERIFLKSSIHLLVNRVDFINVEKELLEKNAFKLILKSKLIKVFSWTIKSKHQKFVQKHQVDAVVGENFT